MKYKKKAPSLKSQFQAEYNALNNAIHRCHNPKHVYYYNYGGRGIQVCEEWRTLSTGWPAFLAYIGPRPSSEHTLDRIDNDGNYEPGNVRWSTRTEQQNNRRPNKTNRDNRDLGWGSALFPVYYVSRYGVESVRYEYGALIPFAGRTQTIIEWCRELDLKVATVRQRFQRGLPPEQALSTNTSRAGMRPSSRFFVPSSTQQVVVELLDEPNDPLKAQIDEAIAILAKASAELGKRLH